MSACKNIMCKYNLTKDNVKRFLKVNHPDKKAHPEHDNSVTEDEFKKIVECYKSELFCASTKKDNKDKNMKVTKKNRAKIFSCMRKTANFSKITMTDKFDKTRFDVEQFRANLNESSPKILQLMNNIKELDKKDMENHGKNFKHFIFSDVKEGGYGARIIASAFVAMGYNNIVHARKIHGVQKPNLYVKLEENSSKKNFALLSSNSIYGATFSEKLKKQVLSLYNERPGNINGSKVRFIILDSGFKEGIDLFDVKYVHIFEPHMTIADLKQIVGRATRTCGQKGLEFLPNIGWPLYVYNYYLTIPESIKNTFTASKFLSYNIENPAKDEKDSDIMIFKNVEKFNDAAMLYSEFDKAMHNLSKQLFDLAPTFSVDFYLTKNLHVIDDLNHQFMEKDFYLMGGAKKNVFNKLNRHSRYYNIDLIKCKGKCGSRTSNDIPISVDFMKRVYKKYNHSNKLVPKQKQRQFFCQYMLNEDNKFCRQLNHEWSMRYAYVPEAVEKGTKKSTKEKLEEMELEINEDDSATDKDYDIDYDGTKSPSHAQKNDKIPSVKYNFLKMRDFIKSVYGSDKSYVWEPLKIENKCIPIPGEAPKKAYEIELNPTQKFVSTYFTPSSPYKGMLLWHSVGTGKTCTGIATASANFETKGYTILWVTRTTLKSDIWKNIFDQVCHSVLKTEMELGLILPDGLNKRKKLISDRWLEPMSYKQFSNLLEGKNQIYNILRKRNGNEDLLHKTLIIIDEAHKLYGGDLKSIEKPDTDIMEKLIRNSYKKSGANSCKLLLMTATPVTNNPLELFSLTNLFMTNESEKITTDKNEFKKQYMTNENILSENGVKNLANKLSGYISYLNREKDATQFSQPIMINVPVLMSSVAENELRDAYYLDQKMDDISEETKRQITDLKAKIRTIKAEIKEMRTNIKDFKTLENTSCKEKFPDSTQKAELKKCLADMKEEINMMNEDLKTLVDEMNAFQSELTELDKNKYDANITKKQFKEKLKLLKNGLIQEILLYNKCAHLKYVSLAQNAGPFARLKMKSDSKSSNSSNSSKSSKSSNSSKSDKPDKPKKTRRKTKLKKTTTKAAEYASYSN